METKYYRDEEATAALPPPILALAQAHLKEITAGFGIAEKVLQGLDEEFVKLYYEQSFRLRVEPEADHYGHDGAVRGTKYHLVWIYECLPKGEKDWRNQLLDVDQGKLNSAIAHSMDVTVHPKTGDLLEGYASLIFGGMQIDFEKSDKLDRLRVKYSSSGNGASKMELRTSHVATLVDAVLEMRRKRKIWDAVDKLMPKDRQNS